MKSLTPELVEIYNTWKENFVDDFLNFEDTSVGIYSVGCLDERVIKEIELMDFPIIHWNADTLIINDEKYHVVFKLIEIGEDAEWVIAGIR